MTIPWDQAIQVGGVGFGMVFVLLIILAVLIWLTGLVLNKIGTGKSEADDEKKGEQKLAQETVEVPLTGKIISVNVKPGDVVKEGDVLCLLESMKMENPILAPVNGTVTEVGVTIDQVVKPGETIAVIEY